MLAHSEGRVARHRFVYHRRRVSRLRVARLVVQSPSGYTLSDPSVAHVLRASLGAEELRAYHFDWAGLLLQAEPNPIAVAFHLVKGGEPERAVQHLQTSLTDAATRIEAINRSALSWADGARAKRARADVRG